MSRSRRWRPGRLLVGWALGVLTTIGLVTLVGGWFEYRQLSTAEGSGSPARRRTPADSACQVDRDGAINVGSYEIVPHQNDPCYLRRPRIRPWQWGDGIREQIGRMTGPVSSTPVDEPASGARFLPPSSPPTPRVGRPVIDRRLGPGDVTTVTDTC